MICHEVIIPDYTSLCSEYISATETSILKIKTVPKDKHLVKNTY